MVRRPAEKGQVGSVLPKMNPFGAFDRTPIADFQPDPGHHRKQFSSYGHRSTALTLTVYGHLFDLDFFDLAARLDASRVQTVSSLDQSRGEAR